MRQVNTSGYPVTVHLPDGPVDVGPGEHIEHAEPVAGFVAVETEPARGKKTEPAPAGDDTNTPEDAS